MLHPDQTFNFTFASDAEKPESERRALVCRYGSAWDWIEFDRRVSAIDKAERTSEPERMEARLAECLRFVTRIERGGGGVQQNATVETLARSMTPLEIRELIALLPSRATLSESDLKKSASNSAGGSAPGASTAGPGNRDATAGGALGMAVEEQAGSSSSTAPSAKTPSPNGAACAAAPASFG